MRPDKTVIVIAHRLSTVADADRVVVIDGGRIVDHGTPGDLRARDGALAQRTDTQERRHGPSQELIGEGVP